MTRLAWLAALSLLAACTEAPTASPELNTHLLTAGDLPQGFADYTPPQTDRPKSDRPECEEALNRLEIEVVPPEARAAFISADGTIVQHVVRRGIADIGPLDQCGSFSLTYPDGMTATETVEVRSIDPWSAEIVADFGALSTRNRLTVITAGDRVAIVSIVTPDGAEDSLVDTVVGKARAKLSR
ncbi:hypothetical protein [Actinokineospora sp. HUAS TT18]|uniref:hypothetical protein n=1 Tax=Actinokineospora sp. HUAS TT18 TaxID=3447451 RepID=UPI003F5209B2